MDIQHWSGHSLPHTDRRSMLGLSFCFTDALLHFKWIVMEDLCKSDQYPLLRCSPRAFLLPLSHFGVWIKLNGLIIRKRQWFVDWLLTFHTSKGLWSISLLSSEGLVNASSLALEETKSTTLSLGGLRSASRLWLSVVGLMVRINDIQPTLTRLSIHVPELVLGVF